MTFFRLYILGLFLCSLCYNEAADAEQILEIQFVNMTNSNVKYLQRILTISLSPETTTTVVVNGISPFGEFVLLQVHAQFRNVILKNGKDEVTGKNIGLVQIIESDDIISATFTVYNPNNLKVNVLIGAVLYGESAPIPGGCNLVFSAEISPFLKLDVLPTYTALQFQSSGSVSSSCDTLAYLSTMEYYVFVQYISSDDFSEESYFDAIKRFITVDSIDAHGQLAVKVPEHAPPEFLFPSYPGIGSFYVVVVKNPEISDGLAAYVPIFTYACDVNLEYSQCEDSSSHFEWLVLFMGIFFGGLLIIAGHRLYRVQQFIMGFLAAVLIAYILLGQSDPEMLILKDNGHIAVAIGAGLGGGILWLFTGIVFHWPIVTVSLPGFLVGFLYGCVIFYTPIVRYSVFGNDLAYWGLFCSVTFIYYFLMVPWLREFSIFCCVQIGVFLLMLAEDFLTKGTIRYILLNVLRRATSDVYKKVFVLVPYQISDWITIGIAIILLFIFYNLQRKLERNRTPFPPPVKVSCFTKSYNGATERTPLIN